MTKRACSMRSYISPNQMMFDGFETEFEKWLDSDNRSLSGHMGRPGKDARRVIGAVIIKHKLCLSDEETIEQIRENP